MTVQEQLYALKPEDSSKAFEGSRDPLAHARMEIEVLKKRAAEATTEDELNRILASIHSTISAYTKQRDLEKRPDFRVGDRVTVTGGEHRVGEAGVVTGISTVGGIIVHNDNFLFDLHFPPEHVTLLEQARQRIERDPKKFFDALFEKIEKKGDDLLNAGNSWFWVIRGNGYVIDMQHPVDPLGEAQETTSTHFDMIVITHGSGKDKLLAAIRPDLQVRRSVISRQNWFIELEDKESL